MEQVLDDNSFEEDSLPINSHVYFPVEMQEKEEAETVEAVEAAGAAGAEATERREAPPPTNVSTTFFCTESRWTLLKKKVVENFLPLGFAVALLVALSFPYPGKQLGTYSLEGVYIVQAINNVCVFFVSGITLNVSALANALTHWRVVVLGVVVILGLTPLLGFVMVRLPLEPVEFSAGLAIFCCVPTTLGVRRVGGKRMEEGRRGGKRRGREEMHDFTQIVLTPSLPPLPPSPPSAFSYRWG